MSRQKELPALPRIEYLFIGIPKGAHPIIFFKQPPKKELILSKNGKMEGEVVIPVRGISVHFSEKACGGRFANALHVGNLLGVFVAIT